MMDWRSVATVEPIAAWSMNQGMPEYVLVCSGPCGSGKSTLVAGLQRAGFEPHHIAQEHSYVEYMWQWITSPGFLTFLSASLVTCTKRRKLDWQEADYEEKLRRLAHAHQHADFVIETDDLAAAEVPAQAVAFLHQGR